jgi:DNA topoisomerase-1
MSSAIYDQTTVEIEAAAPSGSTYGLRASGRILKFSGWLAVYETPDHKAPGVTEGLAGEGESTGDEEKEEKTAKELLAEAEDADLPELADGEVLAITDPPGVVTEQKFTQPPPRYSEGSLVRELEERGIGRPSTYAEIISKVQARAYVERVEGGRAFRPTQLGKFVVDGLVKSSLDFMDPAFTSNMEGELDAVAEGKEGRVALLKRFYKRFRAQLDKSKKLPRWNPEPTPTKEICEVCGTGIMMKRWSKNGWFLGCANYPNCKNTRDLGPDGNGPTAVQPPRETGILCDKCGRPMVIKTGRYGEFLSCTGYPKDCSNTKPVPIGVPCPKCGGDIIEIRPRKRGGKTFWGCTRWNDETVKCDFKVWQKPIKEPCPLCASPFLVRGGTKAKPMIVCANKECDYKRPIEDNEGDGAHPPAPPPPAASAPPPPGQ